MKLNNILKGIEYLGEADERYISGIFYDSRKIMKIIITNNIVVQNIIAILLE